MLTANRLRFAKIVGKLAYMYDQAAASAVTLSDIQYALMQEFANSTDRDANLPELQLLATKYAQITNAISAGPVALQTTIVVLAQAIFTSDDFVSDLTTVPSGSSIFACLTAWATEMGAGVDNVTFTTLAATGIVHFLNVVGGSTFTWHTAADGSATYKDSVYCVGTMV